MQDGGEEADGVDGEGADGQENGHYSDTTASANGSDDDDGDGSTAATDGSNLRASPAEHVSGCMIVLDKIIIEQWRCPSSEWQWSIKIMQNICDDLCGRIYFNSE